MPNKRAKGLKAVTVWLDQEDLKTLRLLCRLTGLDRSKAIRAWLARERAGRV